MISSEDHKNGLVKISWPTVRDRVAKVEPEFAKIVDEIDPDKSHLLFLAYYPYGAIKGDTRSTLFPHSNGSYYRVDDPNAHKEVVTHLGYSKDSAPFALLLEKNAELFVDLPYEKITIPCMLYAPGSFFPFARILSRNNKRIYAPNGALTMTSGARSIFMLPNIGCAKNHANLQKDFNLQLPPARVLYDHWEIFKGIVHSERVKNDWRACFLYFSEKWLDKIQSDKAWIKLKLYLFELAWKHYEFQRSHLYYDLSVSIIQKKRNLKPNPYLVDTAKHLIATALGAAPGYVPASNDESMPKEEIQQAFVESYGLKKYFPTILQPSHFYFENEKNPIYYSLQHPATRVFSPRSNITASTLTEIRELERITRIFAEELSKSNNTCSNTVVSAMAKNIEFNYYHNKIDPHRIIKSSLEIFQNDDRFKHQHCAYISSNARFASDAPFVRGCISLKTKN